MRWADLVELDLAIKEGKSLANATPYRSANFPTQRMRTAKQYSKSLISDLNHSAMLVKLFLSLFFLLSPRVRYKKVLVSTFLLTNLSAWVIILSESEADMNRYQVIDTKTGNVIGIYKSRRMASRKADKLDLEYGAIRYTVSLAPWIN